MIAALASGLLGQLEGIGSLSSGVSGIAALLGGRSDSPAATPFVHAAVPRHGGGGAAVGALSDQLQSLLLQQQSTLQSALASDNASDPSAAAGAAVQADDVSQGFMPG